MFSRCQGPVVNLQGRLGHPQTTGIVCGKNRYSVDTNSQVLHSAMFSSDDLPAHWERLDEFEGEGYDRVLTTVLLGTGEQVPAFIYALRR